MDNFGDFFGYPYVDPFMEKAFKECKTDEEKEELAATYVKIMVITIIGTVLAGLFLISIACLVK